MQRIAVEYRLNPPKIITKVVEFEAGEAGYAVVRGPGEAWRLPRPTEFFGETPDKALSALREALDELVAVAKLYEDVMKPRSSSPHAIWGS